MPSVNPSISFSIASKVMAASVELKGTYSAWGMGLMELKAWMDRRGIAAAGGPFALFYDNPTKTPATELRSEACFPVSKRFESEARFRFKGFPECSVAETRHNGSPVDYTRTYGAFLEQLINSGYRLIGPAREYFQSPSANLGPGMGWLIQQPVSKRV